MSFPVRRLIDSQFPSWAGLPVRPVARQGWDNRTFRLGDDMLVRLPSAAPYALAVEKEQRWLPVLAPELPLPIPVPLAQGEPAFGYPHAWSVYRWLDGEPADRAAIASLDDFAASLAAFLVALQAIDPTDGPAPGQHNWHRGGPLQTWEPDTAQAFADLADGVPDGLAEAWQRALDAPFTGPPVWFHGDVAAGNLLVRDGALAAVIDFGTCGVGDPACDLAIAWTLFTGRSREIFRDGLGVDDGTWARGQGWAIWKALITWASERETDPEQAAEARRVLEEVLSDDRAQTYDRCLPTPGTAHGSARTTTHAPTCEASSSGPAATS